MPLRIEKLFQEYNLPGSFAVASCLLGGNPYPDRKNQARTESSFYSFYANLRAIRPEARP